MRGRKPPVSLFSGPARRAGAWLRGLLHSNRRSPALWAVLLLAAAVGCGGLASCRSGEGEFAPVIVTTVGDTSEPAGNVSAPVKDESLPDGVQRVFLDGLDLDGAGGKDDSVTVTSYGSPVAVEEWTTVVEASLGDGRKLSWEYVYPCYPGVMAGYLTSTEHQCLAVEMGDRTSNYGFAAYFVLEVEGDALVERARLGGVNDPSALNRSGDTLGWWERGLVSREDSPLQALRVPTLYTDKWHEPLYGDLYWDGTAFVFELDAIAPLTSEPDPPDPSEPDLDAEAREAYALALEGLIKRHVFPDGTACDSVDSTFGDMETSTFLVHDVDRDGLDELIVNYRGSSMAGMRGLVLGYDPATGGVYTELDEFPMFTFYSNGAIAAGWSHAQWSWSEAPFWPYTMYTHRQWPDRYEEVGSVDAWYKSVSDANSEALPPFPTELDASGTGVLYIISKEGETISTMVASRDDLSDAAVYQEWLNGCTGGTRPLVLEELPLTMENIRRLREERTT